MKRGIIFIVLAMYGIMAAFCNSYKWKAATGEIKCRKDGTTFNVWDRKDLTKEEFETLRNTEFKNARVLKREYATMYIIEKDGKQISIIDVEDNIPESAKANMQ